MIHKAAYSHLQKKMELALQKKSKSIGDADFIPYRYNLNKFGFFELGNDGNSAPYSENPNKVFKVYSP